VSGVKMDMLKGGTLAPSLEGTSTRRFLRDIARSRHHTPSRPCARRRFCGGSQHGYYEMEKAANAHFGPLVGLGALDLELALDSRSLAVRPERTLWEIH
jgi:hypothetical protein